MNKSLKQEVLQLIRTNNVKDAYLRLIPIVEEDVEAADLLLIMLIPTTAVSLLADYEEEIRQGAMEGKKYMMYIWAVYNQVMSPYKDSDLQAFDFFTKAIEAGIADARALRSNAWIEGTVVPVNRRKVEDEIRQALEEGSRVAALKIMKRMVFGTFGYAKEPQKAYDMAYKYVQQCEQQCDIVASHFYYVLGLACEEMKRFEESEQWYRKAFEEGDPTVCLNYALAAATLENNSTTPLDTLFSITDKGKEMMMSSAFLDLIIISKEEYNNYNEELKEEFTATMKEQLFTAVKLGEDMAAASLGDFYRNAEYGFPCDAYEAFSLYSKAATMKSSYAYQQLAQMIADGSAPSGYGKDFMHECEIRALRLGEKDMLDNVVEAYKHGFLTQYAAEIEQYYIPEYEAKHFDDNEDFDSEGSLPDDAGINDEAEVNEEESLGQGAGVDMSDRERYEHLLKQYSGKKLTGISSDLDNYREICDLCVYLSKQNLEDMDRPWETAELTRVFIHFASHLHQYEHLSNYLYSAVKKMNDCIFDHPRLKVKVLKLFLSVLIDIETQSNHDLSITEDVRNELRLYERNIEFADKGQLGQIRERGHLKSDPVEWTERWEEVIDDADKVAYDNLKDMPRGMGFCYAFWHERTKALKQFGIYWKSPKAMNPKVIFD
ncbi:MAG: hypothetical protein ACI358_01320 [Candidatus Limimorpha sp.]